MSGRKNLGRLLMLCFSMLCICAVLIGSAKSCQASERMIDLYGEYTGGELNIGAPIEPEYFDITAMIMDTASYDVWEESVDCDDLTISPRVMQSEQQEVTVKYRFNGTTKTLNFTIKAPFDANLITKRELLSLKAEYTGEALAVGSVVQRSDVTVTARFRTNYKTGRTSTVETELSANDPWTMSSNVIESGTNTIIIYYNYTDIYAEKPKTYRMSATIRVGSTTTDGTWVREGSAWRYRYDDGTYMLSGWQKAGGEWYYLDEYGYMMHEQFLTLDENTYYLDKDGVMQTGWGKYKDRWYYFNRNGEMQKDGWLQVGLQWYYLNDVGAMQTGWKYDKGKWYYLNPSGEMAVGWVFDNVTWYFMDGSGAMYHGWIQTGGKWYYLDEGGAMRVSTWIGNNYVDATGAWTQTR